ncbi:MAG: MFS transporter [Nitrospirae bacterium]|nr:MFS transporter [Nitrospirota bacterium]
MVDNKKRKQIISWCFFDFANSSYSAVIAAVIFPVYYVSAIVGNTAGQGDLWWGRAISSSMVFVALTSPFTGGIADFSGKRKRLMFFYTLLCVSCISGFSLLKGGMILEGFLLVVAANIGMEGGLVFYNSFLPEIADKEYQGRVSAWGYAVGYGGSILSLLMALPLVSHGYYKAAWFMVAVFFLLFSVPAFLYLPPDRAAGVGLIGSAVKGWRFTLSTMRTIWGKKELRKFLVAFLIYEDGVNTVIVFSSIFAATTLGFTATELVLLYIIVQVTALSGAFLMARPIDLWGPKKVVMLSLVSWAAVTCAAFVIYTKSHFWFVACFAGLGLGTVQAASRAFYSQFVPAGHESEYFGVYSLVGKSSAVLGPVVFGYISSSYGSQRPAILAVSIFFATGFILLNMVKGGGPNIETKAEL